MCLKDTEASRTFTSSLFSICVPYRFQTAFRKTGCQNICVKILIVFKKRLSQSKDFSLCNVFSEAEFERILVVSFWWFFLTCTRQAETSSPKGVPRGKFLPPPKKNLKNFPSKNLSQGQYPPLKVPSLRKSILENSSLGKFRLGEFRPWNFSPPSKKVFPQKNPHWKTLPGELIVIHYMSGVFIHIYKQLFSRISCCL